MFRKELERRNIASADDIPDESASQAKVGAPQKLPFKGANPPPRFGNSSDDDVPPQLQRSRQLNSEGLEGLIPRATELIKLGVSFTFAFLPFFVGVTLAFLFVYSVSYPSTLHGIASIRFRLSSEFANSCRYLVTLLCILDGPALSRRRCTTHRSCLMNPPSIL
jgi:hypothetical protein